MDAEHLKKISLIAGAVSEIIRNRRTDGRTDKSDFISPFGLQPGTKNLNIRSAFLKHCSIIFTTM